MRIRYHKKFIKRFKKLSPTLRKRVVSSIRKFTKDPFDKTLHNHLLAGDLLGKRAFSVTGDLRVIFEEHDNYVVVIMLDVGTHSQVYGQ